MAMGFNSLSMPANSIPKVKSIIRFLNKELADKILASVLAMDNSRDIQDYLYRNLDDIGITPIFKPRI